jgi:hypothetical protein
MPGIPTKPAAEDLRAAAAASLPLILDNLLWVPAWLASSSACSQDATDAVLGGLEEILRAQVRWMYDVRRRWAVLSPGSRSPKC